MEQESGDGLMQSLGPGQSVGPGAGDLSIPLARLKRPPLSSPAGNGVSTLIAALVGAAFTCALFVPQITRIYERWLLAGALAADGRTLVGRIVSHSKQQGDDEPVFHVCYAYAVPAPGAPDQPPRGYEACEAQSGPAFAALSEGKKVTVRYSASHPERAALTMGMRIKAPGSTVWVSLCFMVPFFLMSVGGTVAAITGLRNRGQLERRAVLASAVVFDRWQDSSGESTDDCVAYAFWAQPAAGAPVLVTRADCNARAYEALTVGQRTPVRYLPESPSTCELVNFL
ncbi:MAG: DUF3592 domain-containing protein [Polyangia bacterium]